MSKHLAVVAVVAAALGVAAERGLAQEPLGLEISPAMGLPGTTVSAQVNPADVAEHCVTDLDEFMARWLQLFTDPNLYNSGAEGGELFLRFFPGGTFDYQTYEQLSYGLTGFVLIGLSGALGPDQAAAALPQTFALTFAELATQEPIGERSTFDPVTGAGTVVAPDVTPGLYVVAAACVGPSFDIDTLEAGIRSSAPFLESLGLPTDLTEVIESLGGLEQLIAFLEEIGPTLLEPIVEFDALGAQPFTILAPPTATPTVTETPVPTDTPLPTDTPTPLPTPTPNVPTDKDQCKNGGWQQFTNPSFKNQGQCIKFVNTGR